MVSSQTSRKMVKRCRVTLAEVASYDNLALAFYRAARGKRYRAEVQGFARHLDGELSRLQEDILSLQVAVGDYHTFHIWDPKPRQIHAPCFRERVLHHALIAQIGPALDRALVDDSFACRAGKGTLAAVLRAQQHVRRFAWYGKVDVRSYFASIEHDRLLALLARKLKDRGVLALCERIVRSHHGDSGRGLPIGALTSQYFANLYLGSMDRYLLGLPEVRGLVRYMDDTAFFCDSRLQARETAEKATKFARERLGLSLHADPRIQRSAFGLPFLGFRIRPGALCLSRRRMRRYRKARRRWEGAYLAGKIDALSLQAGYAAVYAVTAHAAATRFRQQDLERRPSPDV